MHPFCHIFVVVRRVVVRKSAVFRRPVSGEKTMKRFICVILAGCVMAAALYFLPGSGSAAEEKDKNVGVNCSTVLAEASTGTVISGQRENVHIQQGSLPKLMTVLLAADEIADGSLSPDDVITVGDEAENVPGAVIWLTAGDEITVSELLKSVIIGNANDSTLVLARCIGGTEEEFVRMMNARAFELGMRSTVYKSSYGSGNPGEYTTAADIAKLSGELLRHTSLRSYFTTWLDRVRGGRTEIVNENRLVRTFDGVTGLKAGRNEDSYYLVLTAERRGVSFIAVVLGCEDKDERFSIGRELIAGGFSSYKVTTPQFSDEFLRPVTVRGGTEKSVMISAAGLRELVIPKNAGDLQTAVLIPEFIDAPVKKGQKVGVVGFYNGDTLLYEVDLVTCKNVPKHDFFSGMLKCLDILYK